MRMMRIRNARSSIPLEFAGEVSAATLSYRRQPSLYLHSSSHITSFFANSSLSEHYYRRLGEDCLDIRGAVI